MREWEKNITALSVCLVLGAIFATIEVDGCTALGLQAPQTFNERLDAGYQTIATVVSTADALYKAGKITARDARNIETQTDNVREGLDLAREYKAAGNNQADSKLRAAMAVLDALEAYVGTKR